MRIAYLHYHLETGGVAAAIRRQVTAVADVCRTLVLTGVLPDSPFPAPVVRIPGVAYDSMLQELCDPDRVAGEIVGAIRKRWPGGCDVLHVHNPTLAKNRRLLQILNRVQRAGVRLLCQVHDFAEDGRPGAYAKDPYPADCHWAVLNTRDRRILEAAGLEPAAIHHLPNAVVPLPHREAKTGPEAPILYPIRAIRRKNIGEAILLTLFLPPHTPVWITQPPNSPSDRESTAAWKRFVRENRLEVRFDAGVGADFADLIACSRFLLTTSITEGFGFAFLEPWTAGKLLWGRKLTDICADFEAGGLSLEHLYTRLCIPANWLEENRLQQRWCACYARMQRLFGLPEATATAKDAWDEAAGDGFIDFGLLDEPAQRSVILQLIRDSDKRDSLVRKNAFLEKPGRVQTPEEIIAGNRAAVLANWNLAASRKQLLQTYRRVVEEDVRHTVNKRKLAAAFLSPKTFSLLKWGPYDSQA